MEHAKTKEMKTPALNFKLAGCTIVGPFLVKVGSYGPGFTVQTKLVKVPDLAAASRVCRAFIDEEDLSGNDWAGGEVLRDDATRECVAVVSMNGRVWEPGATNPEGVRLTGVREFAV
jgi:hypothetical protein